MSDDWITTFTGRHMWIRNPRPEDFDIRDIAHALSLTARWGGATPVLFSVAQHSVHVAQFLPPALRLAGLLHDASEAYLGDLPRPIKQLLPEYRALEITFEWVIAERFNLPYPEPAEIKRVDNQMIASEAIAFFGPEHRRAFNLPEPPAEIAIEPWSSARAEKEFLTLYMALAEAAGGQEGVGG